MLTDVKTMFDEHAPSNIDTVERYTVREHYSAHSARYMSTVVSLHGSPSCGAVLAAVQIATRC